MPASQQPGVRLRNIGLIHCLRLFSWKTDWGSPAHTFSGAFEASALLSSVAENDTRTTIQTLVLGDATDRPPPSLQRRVPPLE